MNQVTGARTVAVGEYVDPLIVTGTQAIELAATGPARTRTPEQALRLLRDQRLPDWVEPLSISGRLRVRAALAARGFDLAHRLDDRTLLAIAPDDGDRPYRLLDLRQPGFDHVSFDLEDLEAAVRAAPELDPAGPNLVSGSFPLRIVRAAVTDLPAWVTEHRPGLNLRERLQLSFVFDRFELGAPASSLTLLPSEVRSVRRSVTHESVRRVESELRGTETRTHDWAAQFERTFERTRKSEATRSGESTLSWSVATALGEKPASLTLDRRAVVESAVGLEQIVELVRGVVEEIAEKGGTKEERLRIEERLAEQSDAAEHETEVELRNPFKDRALTFVAHHLLAIHVVHLDLDGVDLVHVPGDPSAPSRAIDLTAGLQSALEQVLPEEQRDRVLTGVLPLLRARYERLGIAAEATSDFTVRPADPGHPNLDRSRRELMLSTDARPRSGPLPVCLMSRRVALRSGSTYVRTLGDGPIAPDG